MSKVKNFFKFRRSTSDLSEWNKNDEKISQAIEGNDVQKIETLLSKKTICLSKLNQHGLTVLHVAATKGKAEAVDVLLNHKADVNVVDVHGRTPLHCAVRHDWPVLAQKLIQNGANISAADEDQLTPLHHACLGGHLQCVQLCIKAGAPLNVRDKDGRSPLFLCAQMSHKAVCKELIDRGAAINAQDNELRTPLMLAAEHGNKEVCEMFVKRGAMANMKDRKGFTAADYAVEAGHNDIKAIVDQAPTTASWDIGKPDEPITKPPERVDMVATFHAQDNDNDEEETEDEEEDEDTEESEDDSETDNEKVVNKSPPVGKLVHMTSTPLTSPTQAAVDAEAYQELEEEHEMLNQEFTKLNVEHQKLLTKLKQYEGSTGGAEASNIDGTIVESLEEEIADLKERISDEQDTNTELKEEIQILKAQLSAFQPDVETTSDTDSWGDGDEDLFDLPGIDNKKSVNVSSKALSKGEDKHAIATLKSQVLTLKNENDELREKLQNGTNSDDDAQTVPYEQYQELELSSLAEINQLKHQISELENNVLSLSNDKEDSIPLSEYEDLLQGSEMQITQLKEEIMNLQAEIRGYQDKQIRGYQDKPEEDELRELRKEVETLRKQASEPSPQSVLNMKQLEESKDQDIVELSTQLDKLQRQLAEQEEMIPLKSYEEMKMVKEEEIKVLKTHVSVVEADVEKLKQELTSLVDEKSVLEAENHKTSEEYAKLHAEYDVMKQQSEAVKHLQKTSLEEREVKEKEKEMLNSELNRIKDTIFQMSGEKCTLKDTVDQQLKEMEKLTQTVSQLSDKNTQITHNYQEKCADLEKSMKQNDELSLEIEQLQKNLVNFKTENDKLKSTLQRQNTAVTQLTKQCQELRGKAHLQQNGVPGRQITDEVKTMQKQVAKLQQQLAANKKKHQEVVTNYRTHLLAAVQGQMDPDVQQALHHIVRLRSTEQFC